MSFMEGFGNAFAQGYSQERENINKRKDDMFRLTYADYISRRDEIKESKAKEIKAGRKAQALIQSAGKEIPEEAVLQVREWIMNDVDDKTIVENLQSGSWEVTPTGKPKSSASAPPSPVEEQTEEAGLSQPSTAKPSRQPSPGDSDGDGIMDRIKSIFNMPDPKKRAEKDRRYALGKISEATGRSEEEIQKTMDEGYTPPESPTGVTFKQGQAAREPSKFNTPEEASVEMAQAQAAVEADPTPENQKRLKDAGTLMEGIKMAASVKAQAEAAAENGGMPVGIPMKLMDRTTGKYIDTANVVLDPTSNTYKDALTNQPLPENAKPVAYRKGEMDDMDKISKSVVEVAAKYNEKANSAQSAARTFGQMDKVIQSDPRILSVWTRYISQNVTELAQNVNATTSMLSQNAESLTEMTPEMLEQLQKAETDLANSIVTPGMQEVADKSKLLEMQTHIYAYKIAGMMGQSGRSLAEKEREVFEKLASARNPEQFRSIAGSFLINEKQNLDAESKSIERHNQELAMFKSKYGWTPNLDPVQTIDQMIETNEDLELKEVMETLTRSAGVKTGGDSSQDKKNTPSGDPVQPPATQDENELKKWFDALPPGSVFVDPGDGQTYTK